jgi:hypothetical protein
MNLSRTVVAAAAVVLGLSRLAFEVSAQSITGIGKRTTGADIGGKPAVPKTETTFTVKLGAARDWTNVDGTAIHAELVSWPINDPNAATADPATLKFDIVKQGQVRLRMKGKTYVLPLAKLSEGDRAYIAKIEAATKKGK